LYCTESVLLAIAKAKGIESPLIPKIATGFCSGVARTSGTCGAVSGAILAAGLFFGRDKPADELERIYTIVQDFIAAFEEKYGSTNCKELTGCDLGTEEGQLKFERENLEPKCREYTEEATRMVMKLIEEYLR
jgi:C_GCAxxG_C_C family probable redox protein